MHTAHRAGYRETWLVPLAVCFHVEHALGSAYTEGQAAPLYERLSNRGLAGLDYEDVRPLLARMEEERSGINFNHDWWGLRDIPLAETECRSDGLSVNSVESGQMAETFAPVSAIRDEFEVTELLRNRTRLVEAESARQYTYVKQLIEDSVEGAKQAAAATETRVDRLKAAKARLKEENRKVLAREKSLRNDLDASREDTRKANETIGVLKHQVRSARDHLERYRRKFGWLERFGLFR